MTPLRCEHCGLELFTLDDEGGLILHAGGFVREVHGVCKCGHGYHWSTTDRQLEKAAEQYNQLMQMLERYIQQRKEIDKEFEKWTK